MTSMHEKLDFIRTVAEAFGWLHGLGYAISEKGPSIVRFTNQSTLITVYHGRSSGEVGVEVSKREAEDAERFSMSELIRLAEPKAADAYRNPIAISTDELRKAVDSQSERLQHYGERVLRGESGIWYELQAQRKKWSQEFAAEVLAAQVRPIAAEAFRERDYDRVVELLSKIEGQLTPSEKQRLEYARRQVSK
jgi:hypothetical protein